jgi:hypothetical protein
MNAPLTRSVPHLDAALATLITVHPEARARLDRAAQLVAAEAVASVYGVGYLVASASDLGRSYWVQRVGAVWTCECADHRERQVTCKHGWAAVLFAAAERLDAQEGDPTAVRPFPTLHYSAADRFALTPQGEAALGAHDHQAEAPPV